MLPIALGEATKTVPFVVEGAKTYRFTVRFGAETDTDDAEGAIVAESAARPSTEAIEAMLPRFTGEISQVPPRFSALKIDGARAYDLARDKEEFELEARNVSVAKLSLIERPDADHCVLEGECGKGTYVRSLARDLGRALGAHGHVAALRRTRVGAFGEDEAVTLAELEAAKESAAEGNALTRWLKPIETALRDIPFLALSAPMRLGSARGNRYCCADGTRRSSGRVYATSPAASWSPLARCRRVNFSPTSGLQSAALRRGWLVLREEREAVIFAAAACKCRIRPRKRLANSVV